MRVTYNGHTETQAQIISRDAIIVFRKLNNVKIRSKGEVEKF